MDGIEVQSFAVPATGYLSESELKVGEPFLNSSLKNSGGFDSDFYLRQYADVAAAIDKGAFESAWEHWMLFGQYESRLPNATLLNNSGEEEDAIAHTIATDGLNDESDELLNGGTVTISQTLERSLQTAQNLLKTFATDPAFITKMQVAFGDTLSVETLQAKSRNWANGDFSDIPEIEVRSGEEINGAVSAFATAKNTIYISREYLTKNAANTKVVASVLLEEIGHAADNQLNDEDSPGDEGAIFSALVRSETLEPQQLQQMKAEDDTATITLDGQSIQIEQAAISDSGGFEGSQKTIKLDSKGGGEVEYSYEMFSIPDNLILRYEGKNILDTGFVSGSQTGKISIPKGNSDELEVILATNDEGTQWNYNVSTSPSEIKIEEIKFEHQQVPTGEWIEVPATGTTDGNKVRITATIKNEGQENRTVELKPEEVDNSSQSLAQPKTVTVRAGSSEKVEFEWDTEGYAWDANGMADSNDSVKVTLKEGSEELDSETKDIKVLPKPLVLVHGFRTNAQDTWGNYQGFLTNAHPDWLASPVQGMNTGNLSSPGIGPFDNAINVFENINQVQTNQNAWHVDILAHSFGALISRAYLQNFMPANTPDGKPVVNKLLMMGGVNLGSDAAGSFWGRQFKGTFFLRPEYAARFNTVVSNNRGVPFSGLAGTGFELFVGGDGQANTDKWVTQPSALAFSSDRQVLVARHTEMNTENVFLNFVKPRLTVGTSGANSSSSQRQKSPFAANAIDTVPESIEEISPQLLFSDEIEVPTGKTINVDIPVSQGSRLDIAFGGTETINAILRDPSGKVVKTFDSVDLGPFDLYAFSTENPMTGNWLLELNQKGTNLAVVPVSASIEGSPLVLDLDVGQRTTDNRVQLKATLTNNRSPVTGATVTAELLGTDDSRQSITLFDDGLHADNLAADGVYGGTSERLSSAGSSIRVLTQGTDFSRITTGTVEIGATDLVVTQTEPVQAGSNLTYNLNITNRGPSDATSAILNNVLPTDVNFVSASTSQGSFTQFGNNIIFELGKLAKGNSATASIVVTPTTSGTVTNTARVFSNELDTDLTNNSATQTAAVVSGVPDLSIAMTANPAPINLGDNITYTLSVTNNGVTKATGVTLTDELPSGINFVSAIISNKGSASENSGVVTANLGELNSGETATVTINATAFAADNFTNTASITSNETDSNLANNAIDRTITVNPVTPAPTDLELTKTVDNANPNVGDTVTFTLSLTNKGPGVASGIKVTDLLPPGLSFVSATPEQGTYDSTTGVWDAGNMRDNLSRTLNITAKVDTGGSIATVAEVTAVSETDPDSTPNNNNAAEDDYASVALNGTGGGTDNNNAPPKGSTVPSDRTFNLENLIEIITANGKPINLLFDEDYYLQRNPGVAEAVSKGIFKSGLRHFIEWGQIDANRPFQLLQFDFDEGSYLAQNPDVAEAVNQGTFRNGIEHFVKFGRKENRLASVQFKTINQSLSFDETYYLTQNPDVAEDVVKGKYVNGVEHFIKKGKSEKRDFKILEGDESSQRLFFDENYYLAQNSGVADAVNQGPFRSAWQHFFEYGRFESRQVSTLVDESFI